jgi:hypothetical protein
MFTSYESVSVFNSQEDLDHLLSILARTTA